MFTGIIEELGHVKAVKSSPQGLQITIAAKEVLQGTKVGDSIAINGACQTVVNITNFLFDVEVSQETINITTLKSLKIADKVNLERAMKLSDRLGGHMVSGHIDGIGLLRNIKDEGFSKVLTFSAPERVSRYIIYKGSIAIDGISLTISDIQSDGTLFSVSIIPHTQTNTTLSEMKIGQKVNLESDLIAKYVEKFSTSKHTKSGITNEFLSSHGFL